MIISLIGLAFAVSVGSKSDAIDALSWFQGRVLIARPLSISLVTPDKTSKGYSANWTRRYQSRLFCIAGRQDIVVAFNSKGHMSIDRLGADGHVIDSLPLAAQKSFHGGDFSEGGLISPGRYLVRTIEVPDRDGPVTITDNVLIMGPGSSQLAQGA